MGSQYAVNAIKSVSKTNDSFEDFSLVSPDFVKGFLWILWKLLEVKVELFSW